MGARQPSKLVLWSALWTVYLVWGSTYLAIKVSVETLPPLLSAGTRFVTAGLLLAGVLLALGRSLRVAPRAALAAGGLGVALLACGVGVVTVAETRIDSSVAAMIAGSVPLQVVAMRLVAGESVARATRLAALVGLVGLALIVVPGGLAGRLDGGRSRPDARGEHLVVDRLVRVAAARATRRPVRRNRLRDDRRRRGTGRRGAGPRRVARSGWRVRARAAARLGLPRRRRLAGRIHRVRVAPAQRTHLAGGHAPVREPARGDRARHRIPRRATDRGDARRRRGRPRRGLRHRPPRAGPPPPRWTSLRRLQGRARGQAPDGEARVAGLRSTAPASACAGGRGTRAGRSR